MPKEVRLRESIQASLPGDIKTQPTLSLSPEPP